MRVLFLILNYQTYNDTIALTKDIVSHKTADDHVLIVDNDSPNDSYSIIKESLGYTPDVTILKTDSNCGFARGNNYGLRYAEKFAPRYACIINNDVRFNYSTIDYLCEIYPTIPNAGMIAPIQLDINNQIAKFSSLSIPSMGKDIKHYLFFIKNKQHIYKNNCNIRDVQQVGIIPGAFMFIDYSLFNSIGFFDEETFLYCEERFVAKKLLGINRRNYIILNQTYRHEHSKTISTQYNNTQQKKMILGGRLLYAKKYYSQPIIKCIILRIVYAYNYVGNIIIYTVKKILKK